MTTKKKTSPTPVIDMTPSLGDRVSVVSATIFDSSGKSSDLLATGTITKTDPLPGWDYEVTFDGELSLVGRDKIKSRLYNKHQIAKSCGSIPAKIEYGVYHALTREYDAINKYNQVVNCAETICKRMQRAPTIELIIELNSEKLHFLDQLPELKQEVEDARKGLADAMRLLFFENPDDKTPV